MGHTPFSLSKLRPRRRSVYDFPGGSATARRGPPSIPIRRPLDVSRSRVAVAASPVAVQNAVAKRPASAIFGSHHMTIERFALRVGISLMVAGGFLLVAATFCWATVGDGGEVVHSIHAVGGWMFLVFGLVMIGLGIAIVSAVPSNALRAATSTKT
jgi:hypothetical protein